MKYRPLTPIEIEQLQAQDCSAKDWSAIEVAEHFDARYVRDTNFSGFNRLGVFDKETMLPGGLTVHSGIYHATLHNCEIGNNARLYNVHNYIANYCIGDNTCIENVNAILVDGRSTFGNGVRVPVMNEGGGREIPIFNELSASLAYILTLYRHRPTMIKQLEQQIDAYAEQQASERGRIGQCATPTGQGYNTVTKVCHPLFTLMHGLSDNQFAESLMMPSLFHHKTRNNSCHLPTGFKSSIRDCPHQPYTSCSVDKAYLLLG